LSSCFSQDVAFLRPPAVRVNPNPSGSLDMFAYISVHMYLHMYMMVAAGALVRLVGCQAVRPLGVRWAALRVRVGSERAGAGAEWSLHLCCIKGFHRRHARAPRNTAGGDRHTGPAQGKHPPQKPPPANSTYLIYPS